MIPLLTLSGLQSFIRRAYGRWNAGGGTVTGDYTGVLREINAITPVRNIDWLYTAQGAKTSVAYALNPSNGTGDLAYTGSAGRYFQRNDGLFVPSGSNLPPLTKDGLASFAGGTNYMGFHTFVTQSATLIRVTVAQTLDSLFSLVKTNITETAETGTKSALSRQSQSNQNMTITASTVYSVSVICRIPNNRIMKIELQGVTNGAVFFSGSTKTIVLSESQTSNIVVVDLGNDIYNIKYNFNSGAATLTRFLYSFRLTSFSDNYLGSTDKVYEIFWNQLTTTPIRELLVQPITNTPTTTTVADITTDTDSPQAIKDATELTMFWRGVVPQFVNGLGQSFLDLTENSTITSGNIIAFIKSGASNQLRIVTQNLAAVPVTADFGSLNAYAGQILNIAIRAKNNDYAISFNATATQTSGTLVYSSNRDKISLGMRYTNVGQLNGYTELAFIKSGGLTNAELQALSGVGL